MGTLSFLIPDSLPDHARGLLNDSRLIETIEFFPVPTRVQVTNEKLTLSRDANESGCIAWPWPLAGDVAGSVMIRSATLRERPEPYHLLNELVRGKLNQLRNQLATWESRRLQLTASEKEELHAVVKLFSRLITDGTTPPEFAEVDAILTRTLQLAGRITRLYADQLLFSRVSESGQLPTRLGLRVEERPTADRLQNLDRRFSAIRVVPNWRAIEPKESEYHWHEMDDVIEWAFSTKLPVGVGPLIDLNEDRLPVWLSDWNGDIPSLAAFTCDFLETFLNRYRSRGFANYEIFQNFNSEDRLGLSEDDRLRLAARLLDTARQTHPEGVWSIGLAEPWGDYLLSEEQTYSPYVFADTLLRAGYRISSVNLDLRPGPGRDHPVLRDPLEVCRLLELFSEVGVPIEVTLGDNSDAEPAHSEWTTTTLALTAALPQVNAVIWSPEPTSKAGTAESEEILATFQKLRSILVH